MVLTFATTNTNLVISGKTFYAKDTIKALGGKWNPASSSWTLPLSCDNDELRFTLNQSVIAKIKKEKEDKKAEAEATKAFNESPEGKAFNEAKRMEGIRYMLKQKELTGEYHWICCEDVEVVGSSRRGQHTSCKNHGFCVGGRRFTGD
jgi:hypothetical protein